jgi:hypothetical protein
MAPTVKKSPKPVCRLFQDALQACGKTMHEVAQESGCNEIVLRRIHMDSSTVKLPVTCVKPLASALGVDPALLLGAWLEDYLPKLLPLLDEFGQKTMLSASERRLIQSLRAHTQGTTAEAVVCAARELIAVVMV